MGMVNSPVSKDVLALATKENITEEETKCTLIISSFFLIYSISQFESIDGWMNEWICVFLRSLSFEGN